MTSTSTPSYETEAEIDEVILRLDLTLVRPDDEFSSSNTRSLPSTATQNGARTTTSESNCAGDRVRADDSSSSQHDDKKRSKPLDFIRKLRQTGHQTDNHRNGGSADNGNKRKSPEPLKVYACQSYAIRLSVLYCAKNNLAVLCMDSVWLVNV